MALNQRDREVMRQTAETVGELFSELMQLKPRNGPGVRGFMFNPEQAAAIAAQCAPDILDRVVNAPRAARQAA